jgi:hypothetical protein
MKSRNTLVACVAAALVSCAVACAAQQEVRRFSVGAGASAAFVATPNDPSVSDQRTHFNAGAFIDAHYDFKDWDYPIFARERNAGSFVSARPVRGLLHGPAASVGVLYDSDAMTGDPATIESDDARIYRLDRIMLACSALYRFGFGEWHYYGDTGRVAGDEYYLGVGAAMLVPLARLKYEDAASRGVDDSVAVYPRIVAGGAIDRRMALFQRLRIEAYCDFDLAASSVRAVGVAFGADLFRR